MRANEKQKLIDAANKFLSKLAHYEVENVQPFENGETFPAILMTREEYDELEPFLQASVEKTIKVGKLDFQFKSIVNSGVLFVDMGPLKIKDAYIRIPTDPVEHFKLYANLYDAVDMAVNFRGVKRSDLYTERSEE